MTAPFPSARFAISRHWAVLVLIGLLLASLLPALHLGFVSDDYVILVEAHAKLSLTASMDGMHRPVRNILFRLCAWSFGLHPAPYHLGLLLLHLAAVLLLYRFVLKLDGNRWAALVAAAVYGFFPRNHQALFWFAAGQDSVVTIFALLACAAFLDWIRDGKWKSLLVAFAAFALALGFKETAISILPCLFLIDVTCSRCTTVALRQRWKAYLPFLVVAAVYLLWVRGVFGHGAVPQRYYGIQSPGQSCKLAVKFALNMLLPFGPPMEAKEVLGNPLLLGSLLAVLASLGVASCTLVEPRRLLLCVGWAVITAGPTAVFGLYMDRYVVLPFIGVALLLGFIAEGAVRRWRPIGELLIPLLLGAYLIVSFFRLSHYENLWRHAAQQITETMDRTRRLRPTVPPGSVFYFVNLETSIADGQVYLFNTGLNGMLWAWGYDQSVTARWTVSPEEVREQQLVRQLSEASPVQNPADKHYVFVSEAGQLRDVSGPAAEAIVARSLRQEPDLWR